MAKTPITVAYGDGIGPEIMEASLKILQAAGAELDIEVIEIGKNVYLKGIKEGIHPTSWNSLLRTKVFYKAPITTPQGGGYKSLNVTTRKALSLYANVRPCISYDPYIATSHPDMDVVVIRENEEDTYSGIEHRQTQDVYQCLKLITRPGCERIVRYAFNYAKENNRKKVSLFVKDNIMKMTDGIMHTVFDEISKEYPDIETDHYIIDIGAARLADTPGIFDVIVTLNLYGDIISDIAAQIAGSVGLAGTANIGRHCSMFEAIHGSAPDIAGHNIANPSGLLLAGVQMLVHIGQYAAANQVHNAWLKTVEDGIHTADIRENASSSKKVGTRQFADEVIARLGQVPQIFREASYCPTADGLCAKDKQEAEAKETFNSERQEKELVGVDVFIDWSCQEPDTIGQAMQAAGSDRLPLKGISNRGIKVFPKGVSETFCVDHWRVRFTNVEPTAIEYSEVIGLLNRIHEAGWDIIKTENLYAFDGITGYSEMHG